MDTFYKDEILKAENEIIPWGKPVELFGKISVEDGRWLKSIPLPNRVDLEIIHIPFGENLFIDRVYDPKPDPSQPSSSKWYHVYSTIGYGVSGWVSGGINILPDGKNLGPVALDFDCELYLVKKGDNLWDISHKYYQTSGKWGNDTRFYVGALGYVNKYTEGIRVPERLDFKDDKAWESLSLINEGAALWIPRKETLLPLKEKVVSSGSWYFDTAYKVYRVAKKLYTWAVEGVGIMAGIIRGALLSVYDIFEDAAEMLKIISKVLYSLITGEIFKLANKIYKVISKIISNAGEILRKLLNDFASKWNNADTWERGLFRGTVVGYLIGFAIITFLTVGASALVKAMGKSTRFAKIAEKVAKGIEKIPEIMRIADSFPQEALAIAGDAGKHFRRKIGFDLTPSFSPQQTKLSGPMLSQATPPKGAPSSRSRKTDTRGTTTRAASRPQVPKLTSGKESLLRYAKTANNKEIKYIVNGIADDFRSIKGQSVYVIKNSQGDILYVGKGEVFRRLDDHIRQKPGKKSKYNKPWYEFKTIEVHASDLLDREALALEQDLIRTLEPRDNIELEPYTKEFGEFNSADIPRAQHIRQFDINFD